MNRPATPMLIGNLFVAIALALAPGTSLAAPESSPDFKGFLKDFRQAVASNDGRKVAALTRLPFLYEGVARDHRGFLAFYPRLFEAGVRRCLGKAVPVAEDGAQVLFCRPYAFYFRPINGAWRLVEFGADGEDMP